MSAIARRLARHPDPAIAAIIDTWPRAFTTDRAHALGFRAEARVDDLIAVYLEDDVPKDVTP